MDNRYIITITKEDIRDRGTTYCEVPEEKLNAVKAILTEPAKFAGVKVGDWVEYENHTQGRVVLVLKSIGIFMCDDNRYYRLSDGIRDVPSSTNSVIRIIPPSEVIIDFGAFKGTVHHSTTSIDHVIVENAKHEIIAKCNISALKPEIAQQVKALLQEEK